MANSYHGVKPVTLSDMRMAKSHLMMNKSNLKKKITDHQQAARNTSVPASKTYNQSHLQSHKRDLAKVDKSLNTLADLHKEAMNSMQGLNYEGAGKAVPTPMNPQSKGYLMQDTGGSMASSKSAPLKHTGSTDGKSNALGGGGRAQQLKNRGMSGALIGYIGRKKYGASAMAKMSAAGRKRG